MVNFAGCYALLFRIVRYTSVTSWKEQNGGIFGSSTKDPNRDYLAEARTLQEGIEIGVSFSGYASWRKAESEQSEDPQLGECFRAGVGSSMP